jgi:glutaredoxin 3
VIEGSITVYWRPDCKFCDLAKNLLNSKGLSYETVQLGVDMSKEYFKMINPGIEKVPAIFIDEKYIGGYAELKGMLIPAEGN